MLIFAYPLMVNEIKPLTVMKYNQMVNEFN